MPKIYEYFGLIFFFYSNEHNPVHVHVRYGLLENKIEFVYKNGKLINVIVKSVAKRKPLPETMLREAKKLVKAKHVQILNKWFAYFAKNKKPICERITKKI